MSSCIGHMNVPLRDEPLGKRRAFTSVIEEFQNSWLCSSGSDVVHRQ